MRIQSPLITATLRNLRRGFCASSATVSQQHTSFADFDHERSDLVIVGGGIAGSAAAYCCTQRNPHLSVTLIERNHIASGASPLSAGTIWCGGYGNGQSILPTFCMDTMNILQSIDRKGYDIELIQKGALEIATSEKQYTYLYESYLNLHENGYDVEFIQSESEVQEIEPHLSSKVIAAIRTPQSGHIHPGKATMALAEEAQKNGVILHEDTSIISISPIPPEVEDISDRYRITAECGKLIDCKHVIIASGTHCGTVSNPSNLDFYGLNLKVPVLPVKGQIWLTEPAPTDTLHHVIYGSEAYSHWKRASSRDDDHLIPEQCTHDSNGDVLTRHLYGRQCVDGSILFGGTRIRCDDDDFEILKGEMDNNLDLVKSDVIPKAGEYAVSGNWCGIMPFSMDGMPIIGELDGLGLDGIWMLCGFGSNGIMQGPGAAKYVVDRLVTGENKRDPVAECVHPLRPGCVERKQGECKDGTVWINKGG